MPDSVGSAGHGNGRQSISVFLQLVLVALGFACVDLFWLLKPAVEPTQRGAYHWSGDPNGLYLAALADLFLVTVGILLLLWIARIPGRTRVATWTGLLLFSPWVLFMNTRVLFHKNAGHKISMLLFWAAFLATSWIVSRWRVSYTARFDAMVASATTIMIFLGVFGAFLSCRLVWYDWEVHTANAAVRLHQPTAGPTPQPHRIIWMVFDELSYQQLFEHRFPGLQMPTFDAFAAQATSFTQVVPIDIQTEIVLPGLMQGTTVDDIRTSPTGRLLLHTPQPRHWQVFDQHNTVFQDALDSGYSTGVAGWYNPYCRMIAAVLDQCSWVYRTPGNNGMNISDSIKHNMIGPLNTLLWMFSTAGPTQWQVALENHKVPGSGGSENDLHLADFRDVNASVDKLVHDPNATFILLHLPIPHPVGIYDRSTGITKPSGSYVDNLALADKCLASIRADLQQMGQWDSSTIVIMGDHSWRTKQIWFRRKVTSFWKQEDNTASDNGAYDPRPAYMVKLPNQTTGARVDTPFHAVHTRQLLDDLLAHKINAPADLAAWAEKVK